MAYEDDYLPTMALLAEHKIFFAPDGSFTLVFLVSGLWDMTVAKFPDARPIFPRSPGWASKLDTIVPSGICPIGKIFPTWRLAKNQIHKRVQLGGVENPPHTHTLKEVWKLTTKFFAKPTTLKSTPHSSTVMKWNGWCDFQSFFKMILIQF